MIDHLEAKAVQFYFSFANYRRRCFRGARGKGRIYLATRPIVTTPETSSAPEIVTTTAAATAAMAELQMTAEIVSAAATAAAAEIVTAAAAEIVAAPAAAVTPEIGRMAYGVAEHLVLVIAAVMYVLRDRVSVMDRLDLVRHVYHHVLAAQRRCAEGGSTDRDRSID